MNMKIKWLLFSTMLVLCPIIGWSIPLDTLVVSGGTLIPATWVYDAVSKGDSLYLVAESTANSGGLFRVDNDTTITRITRFNSSCLSYGFINDTFLVGMSSGKILKSKNSGANWDTLWSPPYTDKIYKIFLRHASDSLPDSVWIGTGDDNADIFRAVYNCVAGGTLMPGSFTVCWLREHSGILYAGTDLDSSELWQSTDQGVNWNRMNINFPGSAVYDIFWDNDTVYVGMNNNKGLQRSTDGGVTWDSVLKPPQASGVYCFYQPDTGEFIIGTGNTYGDIFQAVFRFETSGGTLIPATWVYDAVPKGESLYLVAESTANSGGLFRVDNDTTITRITRFNSSCLSYGFINDTFLVGMSSGKILKSKNSGANWDTLWSPPYTDKIYKIFLRHASDSLPDSVWIGTGDDNADIFRAVYNCIAGGTIMPGSFVVQWVREHSGILYAGTDLDSSELWQSTDQGVNWTRMNINFPGSIVYDIFWDNDTIYVGMNNSKGLLRSTDGGVTWDSVLKPPQASGVYCFHQPDTGKFMIGTGDNYGDIFKAVFLTEVGGTELVGSNWVNDAVSSGNELWIGTGTDSGRVWRTTDYGITWQRKTNVPATNALTLAPVGQNIYAGTDNSGQVYVSYDHGNTWLSTYIPQNVSKVYTLKLSRSAHPAKLLAGTGDADGQVFISNVAVAQDINLSAILAPIGIIPYNSVISPSAVVANLGSDTANFKAIMRIGTFYNETLAVSLPSGAVDTLLFSNWHAIQVGSHLVKCTTMYSLDVGPYNNFKATNVSIDSGGLPIITSFTPDHSGNTGGVRVIITGHRFQPGATVKLTKTGQPDIVSDTALLRVVDSTKISAFFDCANAQLGTWNLVVTNPDSAFSVFSNAFTIETGSDRIWVDIIGYSQIRVMRETDYIIQFGNSGNVDVYDALLCLSVPNGVNWDIDVNPFPDVPLPPEIETLPQGVPSDSSVLIPIWIYRIPAGSTASFRLRVTPPASWADRFVSVKASIVKSPPSEFSRTGNLNCEIYNFRQMSQSIVSGLFRLQPTLMLQTQEQAAMEIFNSLQHQNLAQQLEEGEGSYFGNPYQHGFTVFLEIATPALIELCILTGCFPAALVIGALYIAWNWYLLWRFGKWMKEVSSEVVRPRDPNDKVGPSGFGNLKYILPEQPFMYIVHFENVDTATAEAEDILITDTLDTDLDWTTFAFDSSSHQPTIATFDTTNGVITWRFEDINLPPNVNPPEGEGWVSFKINQKPGHSSGTQIINKAWITFDYEPPMLTPVFRNTIDAFPPTSSVLSLPETTNTGEFTVHWSGNDDPLGSGIRCFDVYSRLDTGDYTLWLSGVTETTATFIGRNEQKHYFYSIATDNVGWQESPPDTPDAVTIVTGITQPFYLLPLDNAFTNDSTPTFVWTANAGTEGTYVLQYSNDSSFVQGVVTISGLTDSIYTIPDSQELNDSSYYWRVEAVSRLGVHSGYQTPFRFILDTKAPPIPELHTPSDSSIVNILTPTFSWSSVATEGVWYAIQYATDSLFDSLIRQQVFWDTTYITPEYYSLTCTTYYWRVAAFDRAGNWSEFQAHPFRFTVLALREISGEIGYYRGTQDPVPEAKVIISGAITDTTLTDSTGFYQFPNLLSLQNYTVNPDKINAVRQTAVSSYDAALILRHAVGMIILDSLQKIAGDVSGNGQVTAYDAGQVLRYAVGMIEHFPVGDWRFRPDSLLYLPLTSNQLNQDYRAILYGDPSGNWHPTLLTFSDVAQSTDVIPADLTKKKLINSFFVNLPETEATEVRVTTENKAVTEKKTSRYQNTLPLIPSHQERGNEGLTSHQELGNDKVTTQQAKVENTAQVLPNQMVFPVEAKGEKGLYSADIQISYNPDQLKPIAIRNTEITKGFMMAGADYGGIIRIGLAGSNKLDGDLKLFEIVFEVANQTNESELNESKENEVVGSDLNNTNANNIKIDWLIVNEGSEKSIADNTMGEETKLPTKFYLAPPKPNPFGKGTRISYDLPKTSNVRIGVFDASGSLVKTLVETSQPAGRFSLVWDGKDEQGKQSANGIYFIRMKADTQKFLRKVVLLKQ